MTDPDGKYADPRLLGAGVGAAMAEDSSGHNYSIEETDRYFENIASFFSIAGILRHFGIGIVKDTVTSNKMRPAHLSIGKGSPKSTTKSTKDLTKQRNKPSSPDIKAEGRPHSIIEKPGKEGKYTTYYGDGSWKQYRGNGKPHFDKKKGESHI